MNLAITKILKHLQAFTVINCFSLFVVWPFLYMALPEWFSPRWLMPFLQALSASALIVSPLYFTGITAALGHKLYLITVNPVIKNPIRQAFYQWCLTLPLLLGVLGYDYLSNAVEKSPPAYELALLIFSTMIIVSGISALFFCWQHHKRQNTPKPSPNAIEGYGLYFLLAFASHLFLFALTTFWPSSLLSIPLVLLYPLGGAQLLINKLHQQLPVRLQLNYFNPSITLVLITLITLFSMVLTASLIYIWLSNYPAPKLLRTIFFFATFLSTFAVNYHAVLSIGSKNNRTLTQRA